MGPFATMRARRAHLPAAGIEVVGALPGEPAKQAAGRLVARSYRTGKLRAAVSPQVVLSLRCDARR